MLIKYEIIHYVDVDIDIYMVVGLNDRSLYFEGSYLECCSFVYEKHGMKYLL